jgi:SAM-dependent methyltransferase
MTQDSDQVTPERIMQMMWGFAPPLAIEAAIRNRIFDVLDREALPVADLARATGASPRGIAAIADLLVGMRLLERTAEGRYALTPESRAFLVSGKPGFQGGIFRHVSRQLLPGWMQLSDVVATGAPAVPVNRSGPGAEFFEAFVEDLFPMNYAAAAALAAGLDVAGATAPVSVLDLAAGSGVWGIALAQASPRVTVRAVDWPQVLPVTRRVAARFGLAERFTFVAGDLASADFGSGHVVATLGHILHSEGEERSRSLLAKTFAALAPGGTIAIAEFLVDDDRTGPISGLVFAVNMLVHSDRGGTYSFGEIADWLDAAGFVDMRQMAAPGPSPLILATRPR